MILPRICNEQIFKTIPIEIFYRIMVTIVRDDRVPCEYFLSSLGEDTRTVIPKCQNWSMILRRRPIELIKNEV